MTLQIKMLSSMKSVISPASVKGVTRATVDPAFIGMSSLALLAMATAVPPRGIAAALGGAVDMAIGRKAEVFSGRMRGERGEGGMITRLSAILHSRRRRAYANA